MDQSTDVCTRARRRVHAAIGVQADLLNSLSVRMAASYSRIRFSALVGGIDPNEPFEPFVAQFVEVTTTVTLYPNILPRLHFCIVKVLIEALAEVAPLYLS